VYLRVFFYYIIIVYCLQIVLITHVSELSCGCVSLVLPSISIKRLFECRDKGGNQKTTGEGILISDKSEIKSEIKIPSPVIFWLPPLSLHPLTLG